MVITTGVSVYKSNKYFYSSGCNCLDGLCKDIYDCPTKYPPFKSNITSP